MPTVDFSKFKHYSLLSSVTIAGQNTGMFGKENEKKSNKCGK